MTISRRWLPIALFFVIAGAGYLFWQYLIGDALPADVARGNGRIEAVEIDISTKAPGRIRHDSRGRRRFRPGGSGPGANGHGTAGGPKASSSGPVAAGDHRRGFLGSNGCGKTTTMKMLTGLLPASAGTAELFGRPVDPNDVEVRRRVGYMSQAFSLYTELTVRQKLNLHARLFSMPADIIPRRIEEMAGRFGLKGVMDVLPDALPLGTRQRHSLAVAMIHAPDTLILDEPTSGVDPVARDAFWQICPTFHGRMV